jgi:hypothetical protein
MKQVEPDLMKISQVRLKIKVPKTLLTIANRTIKSTTM